MVKISTILLAIAGMYVANFFYKRYKSLEQEVQELRTKCDAKISKNVTSSPKVDDAIQGVTGALIQGLSTLQTMLVKNT